MYYTGLIIMKYTLFNEHIKMGLVKINKQTKSLQERHFKVFFTKL